MKIPDFNRTRYFGATLFFGLMAMTARNATDPDLWWHLTNGQRILATGHVPHTDPFSFTRAGHAWVSHEWLSDIVFYELWKHGGAAALIIFSALITTAGFMFLYRRCPGKRHWAAAATAIGALASAASWGVRPQMFTFTLASLFLLLLEIGESHPRVLISIPPLFLLWLNLHAGFALGPALLLASSAGTSKSKWRTTLSISAGYLAFAWNAFLYRGMVFPGFSSIALSTSTARVVVTDSGNLQFAPQGTGTHPFTPYGLGVAGRGSAYTNFRFTGCAGDRGFCPEDVVATRKSRAPSGSDLLAIIFWRGCNRPSRGLRSCEMDKPCRQTAGKGE